MTAWMASVWRRISLMPGGAGFPSFLTHPTAADVSYYRVIPSSIPSVNVHFRNEHACGAPIRFIVTMTFVVPNLYIRA